MEGVRQAFVICGMMCFTLALIFCLGVVGGGGLWFGFAVKALSAWGAWSLFVSLLISLYQWTQRPWRSGTSQYQTLKKHTYKHLKEDPENIVKNQQAFYLSAERCNVDRNTAVKDWYLICREVDL